MQYLRLSPAAVVQGSGRRRTNMKLTFTWAVLEVAQVEYSRLRPHSSSTSSSIANSDILAHGQELLRPSLLRWRRSAVRRQSISGEGLSDEKHPDRHGCRSPFLHRRRRVQRARRTRQKLTRPQNAPTRSLCSRSATSPCCNTEESSRIAGQGRQNLGLITRGWCAQARYDLHETRGYGGPSVR